MDVDSRWYGSESATRFKQMNSDIFDVEAQARKLGMEGVFTALYRARIALGHQETYERGEFTRRMERLDAIKGWPDD